MVEKKSIAEKQAERLFLKYKKYYVKKLGIKALDNVMIDRECRIKLGRTYRGCFSQNEKFLLGNGYYIINTDVESGPGIHWVSLYITNKTAYIYDSFCRDPKILLKHLVKRLAHKHIKIKYDRIDSEQKNHEIICGHLSISWLVCVKDLGIRKAIKI